MLAELSVSRYAWRYRVRCAKRCIQQGWSGRCYPATCQAGQPGCLYGAASGRSCRKQGDRAVLYPGTGIDHGGGLSFWFGLLRRREQPGRAAPGPASWPNVDPSGGTEQQSRPRRVPLSPGAKSRQPAFQEYCTARAEWEKANPNVRGPEPQWMSQESDLEA